MTIALDISADLRARVDALAARSTLSASQIVAEALERGHSLEWQEQFFEQVNAGIAAAERGDFASPSDIEHVMNKCRPT